jgi:DNA-binding CsgD family transcriptional regulator/PAS domain-containing protein
MLPSATPDLVELIYRSVTDSDGWQAVLNSIVKATGADHGILALVHPAEDAVNVFRFSGWTWEEIELYSARYAEGDLWRIGLNRRPQWQVVPDGELWPREEMEASEAYREFYEPRGAAHGMGLTIRTGPAGQSILNMMRSREAGPFQEAELAVVRPLAPHLRRAALLHGELASMRAQLATFTGHLDRFPYPLLLTDLDGRVLYANSPARELTAARDGVTIEAGRVILATESQNGELRHVAATLLRSRRNDVYRMEIPRSSGKRALRAMITCSPDAGALPWGISQPSLALHLVDPDAAVKPDAATIEKAFALTPAEARVAGKLTLGQSVEEIAAETRTSLETVRTHLKRILAKTGTSRQGELISLILRSAPFGI